MPNNYFRFKQFAVWQDRCAMKVGTLACILGAYAEAEKPKRILDIGAGTGLLTLMMAQRFPEAGIEAIEIEKDAFEQTVANVNQSLWSGRIRLIHSDILEEPLREGYDLIISNPPFFEKYLKSPNIKINLARHNDQLPFDALVSKVRQLLHENGIFYLLLPAFEMKRVEKLARENGLFLTKQLNIFNCAGQKAKAVISAFSKKPADPVVEQLIIRNADNTYTSAFISLLKAFYLHF